MFQLIFLFQGVITSQPVKKPVQSITPDEKNQTVQEFAESITCHGLPRILTGARHERIIWTIFFILALGMATYMTYKYVHKYLQYNISHEASKVTPTKAFYPSITFCLNTVKYDFEWYYCPDCKIPKRNISERYNNGIFNIDFCNIGGTNYCEEASTKWRDEVKGSCFTLFPTKKYYQLMETAMIIFYVADDLIYFDQYRISVTFHDQDVDPFFISPHLLIEPEKSYTVHLKKIVSKRLPHPYPSKCTNKTEEHTFPGLYNKRTCLHANRYINSYKKTKIMTQLGRNYIPEKLLKEKNYFFKKLSGNHTIEELYSNFYDIDWNDSACPLSCYDVDYEMSYYSFDYSYPLPNGTKTFIENTTNTSNLCYGTKDNFTEFKLFRLEVRFAQPETYYLMEEKPAYTLENLFAELGGFLGLMIGSSILSLFEIITLCCLVIKKKVTPTRK